MKKRIYDIALIVLGAAMFASLILSFSNYVSGGIMALICLCLWLGGKAPGSGENAGEKGGETPLVTRLQLAIAFSVFTVGCWVFILLPFFAPKI